MKNIISKNIKSTIPNQPIKLLIYYKNAKTSNLIFKNNNSNKINPLQQTHVVYQYACQIDGCNHQKYIGISRRLTCHLQHGGPHLLTHTVHNGKITRQNLEEGTTIIAKSNTTRKLQILEALFINKDEPTINKQLKPNYTLPSQLFNSI